MKMVEILETTKTVYQTKNGKPLEKTKPSKIAKLLLRESGIEVPKHLGLNLILGILKNYCDHSGIVVKPLNKYFTDGSKKNPDKESIHSKREEYRQKENEFYRSAEWRFLRYQVLKENGGHCCLCGRSAKHGVVLHVDHIIPLSKDWSKRLDKDNLQVLCEDCNIGKSNKDMIDWR